MSEVAVKIEEQKAPQQFHISFSEYRTFLECPFKHFLQKVLQVPEPKNDNLVYGSAMHNAIETIVRDKVYDKKLWKDIIITALIEETNAHYVKGYFGGILIKQGTDSLMALDFWERYKAYDVVSIEELMYEPLVEDDVVPIYFKGLNDMGLQHKKTGRYKILDWKSANQPWDWEKKKKDLTFTGQVVLYQHFFSTKHNIDRDLIDCSFVSLPREKPTMIAEHPVEITDIYRNYIFDDIRRVARQILHLDPLFRDKNKTLNGATSFACHFCEHNGHSKTKGLCDDTKHQVISINQIPEK